MAARPTRGSRRGNNDSNLLMKIAEVKKLADELSLSGSDAEEWITCGLDVIQRWKQLVIDNPSFRDAFLSYIGEDRRRWPSAALDLGKQCVKEAHLADVDMSALNEIGATVHTACNLLKKGPIAGRLGKIDPKIAAWQYSCAIRLLLAIIANLQDNANSEFISLLGQPVPSMYAATVNTISGNQWIGDSAQEATRGASNLRNRRNRRVELKHEKANDIRTNIQRGIDDQDEGIQDAPFAAILRGSKRKNIVFDSEDENEREEPAQEIQAASTSGEGEQSQLQDLTQATTADAQSGKRKRSNSGLDDEDLEDNITLAPRPLQTNRSRFAFPPQKPTTRSARKSRRKSSETNDAGDDAEQPSTALDEAENSVSKPSTRRKRKLGEFHDYIDGLVDDLPDPEKRSGLRLRRGKRTRSISGSDDEKEIKAPDLTSAATRKPASKSRKTGSKVNTRSNKDPDIALLEKRERQAIKAVMNGAPSLDVPTEITGNYLRAAVRLGGKDGVFEWAEELQIGGIEDILEKMMNDHKKMLAGAETVFWKRKAACDRVIEGFQGRDKEDPEDVLAKLRAAERRIKHFEEVHDEALRNNAGFVEQNEKVWRLYAEAEKRNEEKDARIAELEEKLRQKDEEMEEKLAQKDREKDREMAAAAQVMVDLQDENDRMKHWLGEAVDGCDCSACKDLRARATYDDGTANGETEVGDESGVGD